MKKFDLNRIESNNNVFINFKKEIIITLYVDDVLIINHNKIIIKRIKDVLNIKFHIKFKIIRLLFEYNRQKRSL